MDERERTAEGGAPSGEEELARLLAGAGPRPELPADDLAAIAAAGRLAWEEKVAALGAGAGPRRLVAPAAPRRSSPWIRAGALAATLALAGMLVWWLARARTPVVATLVTFEGATVVAEVDRWSDATAGEELVAGTRLRTPAHGGATLRLATGVALQLGAGSELRLGAPDAVTLNAGALGVDTGGAATPASQPALAVTTPLGVVRDVGTRFSVRLLGGEPAALRVQVRAGAVDVSLGERTWTAAAGEQLTLHRDGTVLRRPLAGDDLAAVEADRSFAFEGRTVAELLAWVERETGWEVRYADPGAAAVAARGIVYGEVPELSPQQAAFTLLPGAGLEAELSGAVLTVRRRDD
jgi:hypothetical protein